MTTMKRPPKLKKTFPPIRPIKARLAVLETALDNLAQTQRELAKQLNNISKAISYLRETIA